MPIEIHRGNRVSHANPQAGKGAPREVKGPAPGGSPVDNGHPKVNIMTPEQYQRRFGNTNRQEFNIQKP